jgi:hypothetical protein
MSKFAFFRFKSNNLLTLEEEAHKQEIIDVTEEVLDAKGIECDARIAKISERQLREILEEVRKLRKKRRGAGSAICQVGGYDNLSMDSLRNRLLVTLGIGTLFFGLSLFVIRVPIRTIIIFFALGKPVDMWI